MDNSNIKESNAVMICHSALRPISRSSEYIDNTLKVSLEIMMRHGQKVLKVDHFLYAECLRERDGCGKPILDKPISGNVPCKKDLFMSTIDDMLRCSLVEPPPAKPQPQPQAQPKQTVGSLFGSNPQKQQRTRVPRKRPARNEELYENLSEEDCEGGQPSKKKFGFVTARQRMGKPPKKAPPVQKRPRGFNPPSRTDNSGSSAFRADQAVKKALNNDGNSNDDGLPEEYLNDPRLKGLDPKLVERIESEVLQEGDPVTFDDIAGLKFAKENIEEIVVWPLRNPEYYTGLRQLPKGLLLFGPPGTGKTLIGKAIAHEVNATFFSISASSLTSKWIGEGEKTVRALFGVAAVKQPSVVFIDEVDSLLSQRSADENESSRRIKTEFLVQLDGAGTSSQERILVIGATNRPQELDEAARRRFIKRLYIPLPDEVTRRALLTKLLDKNENSITESELQQLCDKTDGYSGADVTNLAREASMGPLRDKMRRRNQCEEGDKLRPICFRDFSVALRSIRASVSQEDLKFYVKWNNEFGTQEYVQGNSMTE